MIVSSIEIDLTYEGIATLPYRPIPQGVRRIEIDLTYEGIATYFLYSYQVEILQIEIDLTYEGIATKRKTACILGCDILKLT